MTFAILAFGAGLVCLCLGAIYLVQQTLKEGK